MYSSSADRLVSDGRASYDSLRSQLRRLHLHGGPGSTMPLLDRLGAAPFLGASSDAHRTGRSSSSSPPSSPTSAPVGVIARGGDDHAAHTFHHYHYHHHRMGEGGNGDAGAAAAGAAAAANAAAAAGTAAARGFNRSYPPSSSMSASSPLPSAGFATHGGVDLIGLRAASTPKTRLHSTAYWSKRIRRHYIRTTALSSGGDVIGGGGGGGGGGLFETATYGLGAKGARGSVTPPPRWPRGSSRLPTTTGGATSRGGVSPLPAGDTTGGRHEADEHVEGKRGGGGGSGGGGGDGPGSEGKGDGDDDGSSSNGSSERITGGGGARSSSSAHYTYQSPMKRPGVGVLGWGGSGPGSAPARGRFT